MRAVLTLKPIDVIFQSLFVKKRMKNIDVTHVAVEILLHQLGIIIRRAIGAQASGIVMETTIM